MTRPPALLGTEREVLAMIGDVDDAHRQSLSRLHHHGPGLVESMPRVQPNRRAFLLGSTAAVGAMALAACGGSKGSPSAVTPGTVRAAHLSGDVQIAAMAAGLENLAVSTYKVALDAATGGALGAVPPAILVFFRTVIQHHQDHADAWNGVVGSTGHAKITEVDKVLKPTIDQMVAKVTDVAGMARLALTVEDIAAATYLNGITVIQNHDALKTAASIQPVEMQHAAILHFVLGDEPVPDTFAKLDGARPPSDFTG